MSSLYTCIGKSGRCWKHAIHINSTLSYVSDVIVPTRGLRVIGKTRWARRPAVAHTHIWNTANNSSSGTYVHERTVVLTHLLNTDPFESVNFSLTAGSRSHLVLIFTIFHYRNVNPTFTLVIVIVNVRSFWFFLQFFTNVNPTVTSVIVIVHVRCLVCYSVLTSVRTFFLKKKKKEKLD